QFQFGGQLKLQLCPAPDRIKPANRGERVLGVAAVEDRRANASTQTSDSSTPVKFPGKTESWQERNLPVGHARPCICVASPEPILAPIVSCDSKGEGMFPHRPGPRGSQRICGLTREFAGV